MRYRLTKAANALEGQPMFKILAKVQQLEREGKDIVHFEIGDPDFSTPKNIVRAAVDSINRGETHYTNSCGDVEFRTEICKATEHSRGFRPSLEQVLVCPGANTIIYYAVSCLVEPGDEVIVPDPGFPTYYSAIKFCGAKAVPVPLTEKNAFRMNPADVRERITGRTRLIIMNSPHNPTGSVMTPEEIAEMAELAEEKDIFILSDEIYSRMMFDDDTKFSTPSKKDGCRERTIITNGFSKAFAMTGWRLGVAIGPEDVMEKMGLLLQTTNSCVSPFIQKAGLEALRGDQTDVKKMVAEYKARRDMLVGGLNRIPGITCLKPGGAIYVFPNITGTGLSSDRFAEHMLEKAGVAVTPGTSFGEHGEGYVRLCYATSRERIAEGLGRLDAAVRRLPKAQAMA
jgi:aspartate aminotransferase